MKFQQNTSIIPTEYQQSKKVPAAAAPQHPFSGALSQASLGAARRAGWGAAAAGTLLVFRWYSVGIRLVFCLGALWWVVLGSGSAVGVGGCWWVLVGGWWWWWGLVVPSSTSRGKPAQRAAAAVTALCLFCISTTIFIHMF